MSVEIDQAVRERDWLRDEEHDRRLEQRRYAPPQTIAQRMEALRIANETRSRRARLKCAIKRGDQDVTEVLLNPPVWLRSMHVFDLLMAVPWWGRVKVNKMLRRLEISPSKTVGGLSERQRRVLVNELAGRPV